MKCDPHLLLQTARTQSADSRDEIEALAESSSATLTSDYCGGFESRRLNPSGSYETGAGLTLGLKWFAALMTLLLAAPVQAQSPSAADQTRYTFRYKFKQDETIRFLTEHLATTFTRISTIESDGRSRTETIKVWRIRDIKADGAIVFEQSIERLVLSQLISEGNEIRFDSRSSEAPPLRYEAIAKTIGVPLVLVTISPAGEVLEKEAIYQDFQMGLDDVAMPLPADPIAVGEQWYSPSTFVADDRGLRVHIDLRKVYVLQSVSNNIATIGMKTEVLTPGVEPRIQSQLIQELTKGTIQFDLELGRILNKDMKWDEEVVGFSSPTSFMEFHGRFSERLLAEGEDPTLSVDAPATAANSPTTSSTTMPETTGADTSVASADSGATGNSASPPMTDPPSPSSNASPSGPSSSTAPASNSTERSILLRTRTGGPVLRK